jgi:peptidoglycan/xylan/chitin deacetylase (PgdA/CDA1 family)
MSECKIITLMFHRVHDESQNYNYQQFAQYLSYLKQHYPIVVPGDKLPPKGVAICLTFDDAYYDFYHYVFPLLRQHQTKAILAVSPHYIVEGTNLNAHERLAVPYPQGMQDNLHQLKVPFCTWKELKEMAETPHVLFASHGYQHENLADKNANFIQEISASKGILERKLGTNVHYFIYPYGKMSRFAHRMVSKTYDYGFRIGSSLNHGWDQKRKMIYRIDADPLWTQMRPIDNRLIRQLSLKYWLNRLRRK